MAQDGPNPGRRGGRGPQQQPPSDPRVNQALSALGKPWPEGEILTIKDGVPKWQPAPSPGGLSWSPITIVHVNAHPGFFGEPEYAIDGDLLYLSGSIYLSEGYLWPGNFGTLRIDHDWSAIRSTDWERRFSAPAASGSVGNPLPAYVHVLGQAVAPTKISVDFFVDGTVLGKGNGTAFWGADTNTWAIDLNGFVRIAG